MTVRHSGRLRVGVIGLGRLWETRHKPAFARMTDRFKITAVYDGVARKAEAEANSLGCAAQTGVAALIERADVDVVALLTPQWFGLHAMEMASCSGKPVYSTLTPAQEPETLSRLNPVFRDGSVVFMPEFARRCYPVTVRLKELLETTLGPPRRMTGLVRLAGFDRYSPSGPSTQAAPGPLLDDPGAYLIDWCRFLFGAEPTAIQGLGDRMLPGADENDLEGFDLTFGTEGLARMTITRLPRSAFGHAANSGQLPETPGVQIEAEHGSAWVEMPDRIVWTDGKVSHDERLPIDPPIGRILLARFHHAVVSGESIRPDWNDAYSLSKLVDRLRTERASDRPSLRRADAS